MHDQDDLSHSSGRILDEDDHTGQDSPMNENTNDADTIHDPSGSGSMFIPSGSDVLPGGSNRTELDLGHDGPVTSQVRRSGRTRLPPLRFEEEFSETFMTLLQDEDEPDTFKHAISCPASDKWMDAMVEELDSMKVNRVWELVDLPKGRRAIGNKWVLKIKHKADGSIDRYKARLVAKCFMQ